jgi:hypothetical protein
MGFFKNLFKSEKLKMVEQLIKYATIARGVVSKDKNSNDFKTVIIQSAREHNDDITIAEADCILVAYFTFHISEGFKAIKESPAVLLNAVIKYEYEDRNSDEMSLHRTSELASLCMQYVFKAITNRLNELR